MKLTEVSQKTLEPIKDNKFQTVPFLKFDTPFVFRTDIGVKIINTTLLIVFIATLFDPKQSCMYISGSKLFSMLSDT